jgi:hypothetical protein
MIHETHQWAGRAAPLLERFTSGRLATIFKAGGRG